MAINRSTEKYKYPTTQKALPGRTATQEVVNRQNGRALPFFKKDKVSKDKFYWIVRFRQMDLIDKLNATLPQAAQQDGHCQVLATMFMHLRELAQGNSTVAYKLFKYWCFMDTDSVVELSKKDNHEGEWLRGFISRHPSFFRDYFEKEGQFTITKVALNFWTGHSSRKIGAKDSGLVQVDTVVPKVDGEDAQFTTKTKGQSDAQCTDDYDFLRFYEPNYVLTKNVVYIEAQNCIGDVIAKEIFQDKDKATMEHRVLINLKNKKEPNEDVHAVCITRYTDNPDHLEFVDGNRGIFLIPNDKKKAATFLTDYFNQSIYETFEFSRIQVESYKKVESPEVASPNSKVTLGLAHERRKSIEDVSKRMGQIQNNLGQSKSLVQEAQPESQDQAEEALEATDELQGQRQSP